MAINYSLYLKMKNKPLYHHHHVLVVFYS